MTNTRNYRTPTGDDDPNVPYWNDLLAKDVATDVDKIEDDVAALPVPVPFYSETLAYTVTDAAGRRSWIESTTEGKPSQESAAAISEVTAPATTAIVATAVAALPIPAPTGSTETAAYSVTDANGRRSWIEAAEDGGPTDHAISQLAPKLGLQTVPTTVRASYDATPIKTVSGPDIALFGDSMTAADWATKLAVLTGRTVYRCGVGGETSAGIAARQNALPYLMLPDGGSIPASGGVVVTFTSAGGGTTWPLLQGAGTPDGTMKGTLAGVPGTLTLTQPAGASSSHSASDYYTFTRTTAGTAVPVTRPEPFYTDNGKARRGDIAVIWAGRNNFLDADRVFSDVKAMVKYLDPLAPRFLVLSVHNGTGEGTGTTNYPLITGLNARLLAEYGRRFVDHRSYLVKYGLEDLGITPTSQDLADMAADTVPQSLRTDAIHQTAAARDVTAARVASRLKEMGWV